MIVVKNTTRMYRIGIASTALKNSSQYVSQ